MLKKPFFYLTLLALFLFIFLEYAISSTNKYIYDYAEPVTVVQAASKMIMNSDYEEMLAITEGTEKKHTQETVDSLKTDPKLKPVLEKESEKLSGFEVLDMEIFTNDVTNQMVVVSTKWLVRIQYSTPVNPKGYVAPGGNRKVKTDSEVFVDYLLKKFDDKWKIISKKTR